ncbi:hypothetical protein MUK42_06206 [Musa troglodytarum]|uniref:Uncharacterized protein n=1 Tax=Musa troglodytarum TaxID=320322 RepID=A0A9E7K7J4_9LILI|nr:hypothetical protein MUK42_06206 [Musa troglodytarum]
MIRPVRVLSWKKRKKRRRSGRSEGNGINDRFERIGLLDHFEGIDFLDRFEGIGLLGIARLVKSALSSRLSGIKFDTRCRGLDGRNVRGKKAVASWGEGSSVVGSRYWLWAAPAVVAIEEFAVAADACGGRGKSSFFFWVMVAATKNGRSGGEAEEVGEKGINDRFEGIGLLDRFEGISLLGSALVKSALSSRLSGIKFGTRCRGLDGGNVDVGRQRSWEEGSSVVGRRQQRRGKSVLVVGGCHSRGG